MERSNYSEDCDGWELIRWRGAVASAMRGRRGQAFLRELVATLESMPNKRLIAGELQRGVDVCALGAVGVRRCINMSEINPNNYNKLAELFGIAPALVREMSYENDDGPWNSTPGRRHAYVVNWARAAIREGEK